MYIFCIRCSACSFATACKDQRINIMRDCSSVGVEGRIILLLLLCMHSLSLLVHTYCVFVSYQYILLLALYWISATATTWLLLCFGHAVRVKCTLLRSHVFPMCTELTELAALIIYSIAENYLVLFVVYKIGTLLLLLLCIAHTHKLHKWTQNANFYCISLKFWWALHN